MNLSAIFTAAHKTAKANTAAISYRAKFATALKGEYTTAKAPKVEEVVFEVGFAKVSMPCSYKQYDYLYSFDNVLSMAGLNATQFQKRVPVYMASQAIDAAKAGKQVRFVLA